MKIIGIDPGLRHTGYGIINSDFRYVTSGRISPDDKQPLNKRLFEIHREIKQLISKYKPELAVVEETIVNANYRSSLLLGQARGAAVSALGEVKYLGLAPKEIKKNISGFGSSDKAAVKNGLKLVLKGISLSDLFETTSDESDALAMAVSGVLICKQTVWQETAA